MAAEAMCVRGGGRSRPRRPRILVPLMAAEAMVSQSESGPRYAFGLPAIFYSKRVGWTEWTESGPSLPAFWYSKRVVDRGTRGSVIILRCV